MKAYVYVILVQDTVRYIGKGRGSRLFAHLIDAKRSAARCGRNTANLYPLLHRKLVEAARTGSTIVERVIAPDLSDTEAYRLESMLIAGFHKFCAGQLWNTIDERFMDRSMLPNRWTDPENPLYRLPRPAASDLHHKGPDEPVRKRLRNSK